MLPINKWIGRPQNSIKPKLNGLVVVSGFFHILGYSSRWTFSPFVLSQAEVHKHYTLLDTNRHPSQMKKAKHICSTPSPTYRYMHNVQRHTSGRDGRERGRILYHLFARTHTHRCMGIHPTPSLPPPPLHLITSLVDGVQTRKFGKVDIMTVPTFKTGGFIFSKLKSLSSNLSCAKPKL